MSLLPVQIPIGFTLLVKNGDAVVAGQVIARRNPISRDIRIPLAELLEVHPKNAARYLRKTPGDALRLGEIIAVKPSFITITEVVSGISGVMIGFDTQSGEVLVEKSGEVEGVAGAEIVSPLDGSVTDCQENRITLTTRDGGLVGLRGTGGNAQGELIFVESVSESPVEGAHITVAMIGNIILGSFFTKEALAKASGMGVSGIVTLKINDEDILMLEQKRMLLPILEVDDATWQALAKHVGKQVYLDSVAKTILVS